MVKHQNMKKILTTLCAILATTLFVNAQTDQTKFQHIDSLFAHWNTPNHPGGTVGIAVKGVPVYTKAYGLASMEYLVPNTYATRFNIASVSKQFTALGIIKLHMKGKLSIDDDIRKYLPELPELGHKISFRHMLHHTSGLRSLHTLLSLAGWRSDDMKNNDDLLRFMTRQQDLNFEPGSEYMYCNTGYILSAIIIEKITGENFSDWMEKEIFSPLALYNTYVEDKYNRIAHNYASSYNGSERRGFAREIEYWAYTGSGNIHSNATDLLKWMRYYYDAPAEWEDEFAMMLTIDPLNNGGHNDYAFGVRVNEYKNEKKISHSGSIGGFRSYACTFPERETEIIILTNFSSSGVSAHVNDISDILFNKPEPEETVIEALEIKPVSFSRIEKFIGTYDIENLDNRVFDIKKDDYKLYGLFTGGKKTRFYTASDSLLFNNDARMRISLIEGHPEKIRIFTNGSSRKGIKTETHICTESELREFEGRYWSPELETQYRFYLREGKLYGYHNRHGEFKIEYLKKDTFTTDRSFMSKISIIRNGSEISGIRVTNSRVRDLWLEKIL